MKNKFKAQTIKRPIPNEIIPQPSKELPLIEKLSPPIEESKDETALEATSSHTLPPKQIEIETSERGPTEDLKIEFFPYIKKQSKKPRKPYIKRPIPIIKHEPPKKDDTSSQVQNDLFKSNFKHELDRDLSAAKRLTPTLFPEPIKTHPPKEKKHIDIDLSRKRKKTSEQPRLKPIISPESKPKERAYPLLRIESPYIELNLDESKVYLVIPSQRLKLDSSGSEPRSLKFEVEFNGCVNHLNLQLKKEDSNLFISDQYFFELPSPLKEIKIRYPPELEEREFTYFHKNDVIYAFEPITNNCAKFYYQTESASLPKKRLWILLKEGYDVEPVPDIIEETSIWQSYKPVCIDLKMGNLKLTNPTTNEVLSFNAEQFLFNLEGDNLVEDDLKHYMPLFTGNCIRIVNANSSQLQDKLDIWIQNRLSGYRKFTRNFNGNKISISLPADLPCEAGEFQIDICNQNDNNPLNTLFFRFIPNFSLDYCKTLIIPDPRKGHNYEFIKVVFDKSEWQLINKDDLEIDKHPVGYTIKLPPNKDFVFFSLEKIGKPETNTSIRITVPRLKWKISGNNEWTDKLIKIMKKDLSYGKDLHLTICTNDPFNRYEISGFLMDENKILQEIKPDLKGMCYCFLLNELFDTIKSFRKNTQFRIKIFKNGTKFGEFVIVIFTSEKTSTKLPPKRQKIKSFILWPIVVGGNKKERKGKGFSKEEIDSAGLTKEDVKRLAIPIDKRRKSTNLKNIETLKFYKELKRNGS
ncbi:MAG: ribosomal protein L13e [Candidatus Aenigmatarchaeota archaeon]